MDIGKRIRDLREERGLTQREVARRAGLTPSGVGFIEHGQTRNPSTETVVAIARALGVDVTDLLMEPVPLAEAPPRTGQAAHTDPKRLPGRVARDHYVTIRETPTGTEVLQNDLPRILSAWERGEIEEEEALEQVGRVVDNYRRQSA